MRAFCKLGRLEEEITRSISLGARRFNLWKILAIKQEKQQGMFNLSRVPPSVHLNNLTAPALIDIAVLKREVEEDERLKTIMKRLEKGEEVPACFAMRQGMLRYKDRLVTSKKSALLPNILDTYHDSVFGGHSGEPINVSQGSCIAKI